ncbi:hypothetical protein ElyMa_002859400 [Elysia marginata]|uniref:Uncharacterized protein n=1 Tax=Elysia marginata TaxID=1093978 RepID=A0AAV4HX37_9GAST|nr:hypothetical protein ElyMa_002859400 [Elysia marginata]
MLDGAALVPSHSDTGDLWRCELRINAGQDHAKRGRKRTDTGQGMAGIAPYRKRRKRKRRKPSRPTIALGCVTQYTDAFCGQAES